nr:hypothetical protein [Tanacetum cinerariifolium]
VYKHFATYSGLGTVEAFSASKRCELENPKRQLLQRRTGTTLGLVSGLSGKGVYEVRSVPLRGDLQIVRHYRLRGTGLDFRHFLRYF